MLQKIMHLIVLSCKKSTELVDLKSEFGLSPINEVRLKLHTRICEACSKYELQSKMIDKFLEEENSINRVCKLDADIDSSLVKNEILEKISN